MSLTKYGVEDRKVLLEKELQEVKDKMGAKTASQEEVEYLVQRERDIIEALGQLENVS